MEDSTLYPKKIIALAKNPKHLGRMNDPTSSAYLKGRCGEEMEFYLVIKNRIIEDIKFYSEGCIATRVCGSVTAELATGKSIDEALGISPQQVIAALDGLPKEHSHCSILAVSTLYKAIVDYLFKK
ncbi:MAG: iron-sulfur cluster assembly scaffold protein [Candidatus Omnitrophota bacterium]|jgi:nitrogen fixation NifU-like protein